MKRYAWGLCLIAALAMTGCEEKKEEIPIGTNSSSLLEDEEPADELDEEFPGEDIPDYQVELPEEMSSFTIAIWGEVYKIPVSYEEFISLGWEYDGDDTITVGAETYLENEKFEQEGNVLYVDLMNPNSRETAISKCYVAGIHVDASSAESQGIHVNLPGSLVFQKSTEEEVTAVYGLPIDRYEEGKEIFLTYEYGINRSVRLGFNEETGALTELNLQNFRNPEGEEELENVSDDPTPEVKAYIAPETEGNQLQEFVVLYDGAYYKLPAPVSGFTANGWQINKEESDAAVQNGKYGYVTLEKGGQKLYAIVHNYGKDATTIRNCFVTTLYGDLDTTKVPITVAGGITLGMDEEQFLSAAEGQTYEKTEDTDNKYDIYTFYAGEGQLDYTQVTIDQVLHLVRQIKVVHNQETAEETPLNDAGTEAGPEVRDADGAETGI